MGSFNPLHLGHAGVAYSLINGENCSIKLDEVWLVVSPQNPLKNQADLAEEEKRLNLIKEVFAEENNIHASDVEFTMDKPSYSDDTIATLLQRHPEIKFYLIMGTDNLLVFEKWRNYCEILNMVEIICFHRPGYMDGLESKIQELTLACSSNKGRIHLESGPFIDVSSTDIRSNIDQFENYLPDRIVKKVKRIYG